MASGRTDCASNSNLTESVHDLMAEVTAVAGACLTNPTVWEQDDSLKAEVVSKRVASDTSTSTSTVKIEADMGNLVKCVMENVSCSAHGAPSATCYPHGIVGQSWDGDDVAVSGATDEYPLLRRFNEEEARVPVVSGLPDLQHDLSWTRDCPLYLMGALAMLRLGPDALNLAGARHGATRLTRELRAFLARDAPQQAPTHGATQ